MVRGFSEKRKRIGESGMLGRMYGRGDLSGEKVGSIYLGRSNAESDNCVDMNPRILCDAVGAA